MCKNKGQAIAEFVLCFWIFSFGVITWIGLTRLCLTKLMALEIAELGTDLQAKTDLSRDQIKNILLEQIQWKNSFSKFRWSIDLNPPSGSPSYRFYNLVQTAVTVQLEGPLVLHELVAAQKESYE